MIDRLLSTRFLGCLLLAGVFFPVAFITPELAFVPRAHWVFAWDLHHCQSTLSLALYGAVGATVIAFPRLNHHARLFLGLTPLVFATLVDLQMDWGLHLVSALPVTLVGLGAAGCALAARTGRFLSLICGTSLLLALALPLWSFSIFAVVEDWRESGWFLIAFPRVEWVLLLPCATAGLTILGVALDKAWLARSAAIACIAAVAWAPTVGMVVLLALTGAACVFAGCPWEPVRRHALTLCILTLAAGVLARPLGAIWLDLRHTCLPPNDGSTRHQIINSFSETVLHTYPAMALAAVAIARRGEA